MHNDFVESIYILTYLHVSACIHAYILHAKALHTMPQGGTEAMQDPGRLHQESTAHRGKRKAANHIGPTGLILRL